MDVVTGDPLLSHWSVVEVLLSLLFLHVTADHSESIVSSSLILSIIGKGCSGSTVNICSSNQGSGWSLTSGGISKSSSVVAEELIGTEAGRTVVDCGEVATKGLVVLIGRSSTVVKDGKIGVTLVGKHV